MFYLTSTIQLIAHTDQNYILSYTCGMANSKYEYVKAFERPDNLLPNTWIVIRLDGRGFHKFSTRHNFIKPNDHRAISLMNAAAVSLLRELPDILIAYGVSDEFSFLLPPNCTLFERREAKLTSTVVSTFTAYYVNRWPEFFPDESLKEPLPSFDARAVCYPSMKNIRDYFSWRQVDCHINNLYNTTFWGLVTEGMGRREAEEKLKGTYSKDKHEMLFQMGINYNNEAEIWKKGSVVFRELNGTVIGTNETVETTGVTTMDMTIISIKAEIKDSAPFHGGDSSSQAAIPTPPETTVIEEKGEEEKNPPGKILKKTKKTTKKQVKKEQKRLLKAAKIVVAHIDVIEDKFWIEHPYILGEGTD